MMRGNRTKLTAGAGLATMLLGAVMMIAPSGAVAQSGNASCVELLGPGALEAKYDGSTLGNGLTATGDFTVTFNATAIDPTGIRFDFSGATKPVHLVYVKQASDNQGLSQSFPFGGVTSGTVNYTAADDYSHISFCSQPSTTSSSSSSTSSSTTSSSSTSSSTTSSTTSTTQATTTTTAPAATTTTAVLPEEVVPSSTTTTAAPTTTTTPPTTAAVLGAQVTRLPTTGSGTRNLAGFGAALLGLGAALVVSSNRRVLKRS